MATLDQLVRAVDKVGAPISIGFAQPDFGQVRQQGSNKPIEIGAPTLLMARRCKAALRNRLFSPSR